MLGYVRTSARVSPNCARNGSHRDHRHEHRITAPLCIAVGADDGMGWRRGQQPPKKERSPNTSGKELRQPRPPRVVGLRALHNRENRKRREGEEMLVGAPERGGTKTEEGQERAPKHWSPSGQSKPTPNPDVTTTLDTYVVAQFAPQLAPPPGSLCQTKCPGSRSQPTKEIRKRLPKRRRPWTNNYICRYVGDSRLRCLRRNHVFHQSCRAAAQCIHGPGLWPVGEAERAGTDTEGEKSALSVSANEKSCFLSHPPPQLDFVLESGSASLHTCFFFPPPGPITAARSRCPLVNHGITHPSDGRTRRTRLIIPRQMG